MSNVSQYSTTAASNNAAPPDGFPEGQAPSTVNNCARELMAALAKWYKDTRGSLVTAGSGNAYTITTNNSHAALADQSMIVARADRANTGAATLAVDGLAAKSIVRTDQTALIANDIKANQICVFVYNSTNDNYALVSESAIQTATETVAGILEVATQTETDAESADDKIITPSKLGTWHDNLSFESAEQTISDGTKTTVAHGLGAVPFFFQVVLRCKTAEHNYSIGDELDLSMVSAKDDTAAVNRSRGVAISVDDTNCYLTVGDDFVAQASIYDKNDGSDQSITAGNWRLVAKARL